ncbi:hypothetical protein A2662_02150 [Candidatus Giovannonibacteria bacterium RIFCSPHIGHO2_01_FULL_45_33]|uniref:NadR/Ttd14 AAA domain-containing protein n=1 Tax=Candidatus Giovannonibacteria bacterium RIFCSPLOWO2_01_FULL_45_34 TaxID=1798351 RepID=A0A1F5X1X2_9BACT|nr:MAG: hypothetical protein A2662_02150 [Candidatus Giovannonibacteria bacterium RIFCSPHIGHO2_01_FULL_45_33]OGF70780.1 MAG: hypothetical protein A3C73_02710 [Candidatus Giovannonibacteria bacterium RIFCSPHIGHO2_02_FULL_44_11]OGF81895.1 MAG: hypothetical protein A2930_00260 [Candidatus Giovannonibacteria bacterium RIFCSPLOWO2_01_FULL_45_34]
MENKIHEIALTGGPCSGKTTGIKKMQKKFTKDGYKVFIGREIATDVILGGVGDMAELAKKDMKQFIEVQRRILWENLDQRKNVLERAKIFRNEKCLVLYDSTAMDGKAYMLPGAYERILKQERLTYFDVRDCFHGGVYLVTAAEGAEKFYTLKNNKARYESTLKAAREMDRKRRNVWLGHPHFRIIDNSTGFKKKMKRLYNTINSFLGNIEIERRFLLGSPPDFSHPALAEAVKIPIVQDYLLSDGATERVQERRYGSFSVYYRTKKIKIAGSESAQQEFEEIIPEEEYRRLKERKDPKARTVFKNRYHFIYKFQHFELDQILSPRRIWKLEIELLKEDDKISRPPFLDFKDEITGKAKYSNYGIARGL